MDKPRWVIRPLTLLFLCATTATALLAQTTLTTLYKFNVTDGEYPIAPLIQASDGNLYGTTGYGGANGIGTVFSITTTGALTTLHNFAGMEGAYPTAALVQGNNGIFYGTAAEGGANGAGTIYEITSHGRLGTLYSFCAQTYCADGASPTAPLVQPINGKLYGTTNYGGANNNGTVFSITLRGNLASLQSFDNPGGYEPVAGLVQGANGKFYGTTQFGGVNSDGTIYTITGAGVLTTLHNFSDTDGANPVAGLIQGSNGNFYGTTQYGGANGYGTAFKISPSGKLKTLYSFCPQTGCLDGAEPTGALVQGTDGNLYGTTFFGGANYCGGLGCGTIFKITSTGAFTTLYSFCSQTSCADGIGPYAGLIQGADGNFYGTTEEGGQEYSYGTVFSFSAGLRGLRRTHPTSGDVHSTNVLLPESKPEEILRAN